jgi:hypothetical protein
MKPIVCFLAALTVSTTLLSEDALVVQQLRRDTVGKSYAIRVPIAAETCLFDPSLHRPTPRLVDTEIGEYTLRYYLRADRFMNIRTCNDMRGSAQDTTPNGMYIESNRIAAMHSIGEVMTVKQVDAKPDRIEIQLTISGESGDSAYGKLKLMLGKGYETKTLEQLEMNLARALDIPRIRDLVPARNQYDMIHNEIAMLETQLLTINSAEKRVAASTRLLALYQQEPEAVARLNQLTFTPVPVPENTAAIESTKKKLADAQHLVQQERVDITIQQYAGAASRMKSDCERLPSGRSATRTMLNRQIAALGSTQSDLTSFENARLEVVNLRQTVPQSDEEYAARCRSTCEMVAQSLPEQDQTIRQFESEAAEAEQKKQEKLAELQLQQQRSQQIATLDEEYHKMKRQQSALNTKLVTALGGSDDADTFASYRTLLQNMIQNRQQAVDLGAHSAEQELQTLTDQLQKLQRE